DACFVFRLAQRPPTTPPLFPYTTLFRSFLLGHGAPPEGLARLDDLHHRLLELLQVLRREGLLDVEVEVETVRDVGTDAELRVGTDRKSTRLNSSHASISYAVFCLKKKSD